MAEIHFRLIEASLAESGRQKSNAHFRFSYSIPLIFPTDLLLLESYLTFTMCKWWDILFNFWWFLTPKFFSCVRHLKGTLSAKCALNEPSSVKIGPSDGRSTRPPKDWSKSCLYVPIQHGIDHVVYACPRTKKSQQIQNLSMTVYTNPSAIQIKLGGSHNFDYCIKFSLLHITPCCVTAWRCSLWV